MLPYLGLRSLWDIPALILPALVLWGLIGWATVHVI